MRALSPIRKGYPKIPAGSFYHIDMWGIPYVYLFNTTLGFTATLSVEVRAERLKTKK